MNGKRLIILAAILLPIRGPAVGSIIDDRSQFVGDFTVIDFESRADGTTIELGAGEFTWLPPTWYSDLGVAITARSPSEGPWIGNSREAPQFDAAHQAAGSPPNVLFGWPIGPDNAGRFLRFDFDRPVNAVALTIINFDDRGSVRMDIFDEAGGLIDSVDFDEPVIDETLLGSDFGNPSDLSYGFVGLFAPEQRISYALVAQDRAAFDDLHFGMIPEPGTLLLLGAAFAFGMAARQRRRLGGPRGTICLCALVLVASGVRVRADNPVTGQVKGWVDLSQTTLSRCKVDSGSHNLHRQPCPALCKCIEAGTLDKRTCSHRTACMLPI